MIFFNPGLEGLERDNALSVICYCLAAQVELLMCVLALIAGRYVTDFSSRSSALIIAGPVNCMK